MTHLGRGVERANDAWVEKIVQEMWDCVNLPAPPAAASDCQGCDRLAVKISLINFHMFLRYCPPTSNRASVI
jgi:hypothetical protein